MNKNDKILFRIMFKLIKSTLLVLSGVLAISSCSTENVVEEPTKMSVTFAADKNGVVKPSGQQSGDAGSTIFSVAKADGDYLLEGWYVEDKKLDPSEDIIISGDILMVRLTAATKNKSYTAKFQPATYTVAFVSENLTMGTVDESIGSGVSGTTCTSTATANENYRFVGWYEGGGTALVEAEATLSRILSSAETGKTYTAKFQPTTYTVAFVSENLTMGTVDGAGGSNVSGTSYTSTATAKPGYEFVGWYEGTALVEAAATLSRIVSSAETGKTYTAKFQLATYTVAFVSENLTMGTVDGAGGSNVSGTSYTSTATAKPGYEFAGWYEGTALVEAAATLSRIVSSAETGKTYTAKFAKVASRIYVEGTGDDAKLMITRDPQNLGAFFQFGSIIGWDNGEDVSQIFNPGTSCGTLWNKDWKSDAAHTLANLKEGKGDPCKLVGFTVAEIKAALDAGNAPDNNQWRLPTKEEIEIYNTEKSNWASIAGINGRYFGDGATATGTGGEFFPAAGSRTSLVGRLDDKGLRGDYWTSTVYAMSLSYGFSFTESVIIVPNSCTCALGFSVRCVPQSQP
ncbi:MAG: InlB B-repeat-containing protein [Phocaeicola sp.]